MESPYKEVFDINLHDTRYAEGTATLYTAVLARKHPTKDIRKLFDASNKFVTREIKWHEERRFEGFTPFPKYEERILELYPI